METLFLSFFNRAMAAGWLVLAVLVLRLVFKKAPKWVFCLLWLLVGVRLAVPLEIESVLSLLPSAEVISPSTLYSTEPTLTTGVQAINRVVNPVVSAALAPNPGDSVNPLQVITILAGWVWVIGVAVMLLYCLASFLRLRQRVAEAVPEEEGVWLCETIASPFILGIFRPRIYLPVGLAEPERSYVLAHERAHLSRRDHWIKPVAFVLLALYWFHPLVWVAYVLLCRDIELACDEKVIRILGEGEKKPYSSALLTCSVSRKSIAACPLAFGEVGVKQRIVSILNYKKPAFWVVLVALIASIVAAVCFLTDPVTELPTPLGQRYRVQEVLYHAPISSTEYRAERMPVYEIAADGTLVSHRLMVDSEVVCRLEETKLNKDWFDRYCSTREDAEFTQADAKALRRGNYKAWRYADFKDPAQQMYVLLQQKNGDLLLFVGWQDSEAQTDSASDDSFFTHAMRLEPTTLPERTEEIPAFVAGALVGQHMGLSFLPKDGVDLGLFYLYEDVLTWTDTDGKTELDFVWKETQHLSQEEFETKMKEAGIMFAAELPEGNLGSIRYFSQAENTGIELYYFAGATWINLNSRIFELVPEGTPIIPIEWPTGDDEPAPDDEDQETTDVQITVEPLDPLTAATWGAIRLHNQPYPGAGNISFNYELLDEVTAIGCGEDENGAFSVTTVTRLIAAMYWEFDFENQSLMQPVKEIYAPAVVELQLREDGRYDIVSYWQGEPNVWDTEQLAQHYPIGVTDNVPDFSEETRAAIWQLFTQVTYQGLIESYGIDAQGEISYLFGSIMDGYHRLGNNSEFREEYLDEYNRILCYGDEALRFVLHEFMYGGQVDYRGVLLEEFLLRLIPESSIDLYTETPQEYFDSWCRFMFREYDRLGEEKAFEMYPRMPIFLEVMAEYNTPDESIDESVLEGVYNTPDDSIAE